MVQTISTHHGKHAGKRICQKISDLELPISKEFADEEGSYISSTFYTRFSRDTTDRYRFPTRGSKFTIHSSMYIDKVSAVAISTGSNNVFRISEPISG